ncbi:MAG: hypothetical protein IPN33_25475 [Saprospiraceae bacterium]|nr:hypothetical protein [Saprospiraceae bacterium]
MKELLDEFIANCKQIDNFILSPAGYALLKEELNIDVLDEIHRYKKIPIKVKAGQQEDVFIDGHCG